MCISAGWGAGGAVCVCCWWLLSQDICPVAQCTYALWMQACLCGEVAWCGECEQSSAGWVVCTYRVVDSGSQQPSSCSDPAGSQWRVDPNPSVRAVGPSTIAYCLTIRVQGTCGNPGGSCCAPKLEAVELDAGEVHMCLLPPPYWFTPSTPPLSQHHHHPLRSTKSVHYS